MTNKARVLVGLGDQQPHNIQMKRHLLDKGSNGPLETAGPMGSMMKKKVGERWRKKTTRASLSLPLPTSIAAVVPTDPGDAIRPFF